MNWIEVLNILKTQFGPSINSSIESSVVLLKQLAWTSRFRQTGSFEIVHSVGLTMNNSTGFRTYSTEAMPKPSPSKARKATSTTKMCVAYMEFEGNTIRATKGNKGAFANVLKNELDSLLIAIRTNTNRALYGSGTGELGEIATNLAGADSDTITIRTSAGIAAPPNMNWFEVGQYIDIYPALNFAAGTSVRRGTYRIKTRSKSTNTLTLETVAGAAVAPGLNANCGAIQGDKLVVYGNYMNEPYGLDAIIDNGSITSNFLGISETDFDRWQSYVDQNNGTLRALTEDMVQNLVDEVEGTMIAQEEVKGQRQLLMITRRDILNKLAALVKTTTIQDPSIELKGGYKAVSYCGHPILVDRLCPYGKFYAPNLLDIWPHQLEDGEKDMFNAFNFDDIDAGLHSVRDTDMYYTKGVTSFQMTTGRRNALGKIIDVNPSL